jgi:plasmid stabilization system protein ParE
MKQWTIAPAAAQDLDEIWEYIAEDSLEAADRVLDQFHLAIRKLAQAAGMGHSRDDLTENGSLLFWPVGSYEVIYRVVEDRVEIVAIVHGSRDIPSFIQRRSL